MRKLNGITINGEYLGNSVVINGMFRAICTISPVIMRDFVHIINKIDKLDNAVKIRNFNCGFDCINIEFENSVSKGIASLYFKLKNGEPELTNCKLIIDNQEYSTFQDKITLPDKKNMTNPGEETERQRKIRELRERKMEQQKKLIEEKRQKLEELKKRAAEQKSMSPQELREKKRQELLEKKKQELLAKKRQAAGITDGPTDKAANSESPAIAQTGKAAVTDNVTGTEPGTTDSTLKESPEINAKTGEIAAAGSEVIQPGMNDETQTQSDELANSSAQNSNEELQSISSDYANADAETNAEYSEDYSDIEEYGSENTNELSDYNISDENFEENNFTDNDFADNNTDFDNLSDSGFSQDNYDDISDEELAALEAELDSEMGNMSDSKLGLSAEEAMLDAELSKYMDSPSQGSFGSFGDFAKELKDGLSQGLSEGLSKGLSEGLCALFGGGQGAGFGKGNLNNAPDGMSQGGADGNIQYAPGPDFGQIDDYNNSAAMSARDSYSFDEDSDLDGLSDLYSDFYADVPEEQAAAEEDVNNTAAKQETKEPMSEVDALNAELEALRAAADQPKKDLMSLDEFLEKQKELADAKEKIRRQKLRIVSSKGRISASALENDVFVSGNKVYKWGDTRILDD